MLTRIRNANDAYHDKVDMPASKMKAAVLAILKDEGFVKSVEQIEVEGHPELRVALKYGANRESLLAVARTTLDVLRCDIATQAQSKTFMEAATAYTEHEAKCLYIVEGMQDVNAAKVRQLVKQHQQRHERPPVVFIDYMQLLTIADTTQNTDKQKWMLPIKALKDISRDFKIPVVAISSMNRASYDGGLNMASFKESGNIEYTADVLLALEAAIPDDCKGDTKEAKKKKACSFQAEQRTPAPRRTGKG